MQRRSNPIPVSITLNGKGTSEPSALRSYCMNTRFHISMTRGLSLLTSEAPETALRSSSGRRSIWISEHGPHGPVSPISQKLSCLFPLIIWSAGRCRSHIAAASSSRQSPSAGFPSNTVAYRREESSFSTSTRNSQAQSMASALK